MNYRRATWLVIIAASVLVVCSGCTHTDQWRKQDTALQWIATAAIVCDAWSTSKIQYYDNVEEGNSLARSVLGPNPSTSDTYQYFGTLALSSYFISYYLPARWRPYWQVGNTAYYGKKCMNNVDVMDLP